MGRFHIRDMPLIRAPDGSINGRELSWAFRELYGESGLDKKVREHIVEQASNFPDSNSWVLSLGGSCGSDFDKHAERGVRTLVIDHADWKWEIDQLNRIAGVEAIQFMQEDVRSVNFAALRQRNWIHFDLGNLIHWLKPNEAEKLIWNLPVIANENTHIGITFIPWRSLKTPQYQGRHEHQWGDVLAWLQQAGCEILYTNKNSNQSRGGEIFARVLGNASVHPHP